MSRQNTVLLNVSGGELSPEMHGRIDIPAYQHGNQRVQNYTVLPQGGLQYRNAFKHVHNTRGRATGRIITFSFNESDTYVLEFTDLKMRVYRNFGAVLNTASATITGVTKASPAVISATAHGFVNDQEVYITGVAGMEEINNQFFIVKNKAANTFELANIYGTLINSTAFTTYVSGGTIRSVYETNSPYAIADVPNFHFRQSADTVLMAHQRYSPYKLTRTDHTEWYFTTAMLSNPNRITGATNAGLGVFTTATTHNLAVGDLVYIDGMLGMTEVNGTYWKVDTAPTGTTFTLENTGGTNLNTNTFGTYTSGGVVFSATPRTADPFQLSLISLVDTTVNPLAITCSAANGLKIGDEVYIAEVGGSTELNGNRYFINTAPTNTKFTLKNAAGTPISNAGISAWKSGGTVIGMKNAPKTVALLDSSRLVYANTPTQPSLMIFSRAPDSTTGATRFSDFTTGTNATDACLFTISPVFDKQDSIQWLSVVNKQIIAGCASSVRRVHGDTVDEPISPSSINAKPISNVGCASIQAFSSGQSLFYIDALGNRLQGFLYAQEAGDYVTSNQNLTSGHLCTSNFTAVAQQRGDAGLLWVLREDGVLLGLTFSEIESIRGWHRHYVGGVATVNSVAQTHAKVLSICVEPRANAESVLWAIVERTIGANTYRSVEYLTAPQRFYELEDYFTADGFTALATDLGKYINATYEQVKDSIHVDGSLTYDGSTPGAAITMTPSATTGAGITLTAGAAFFTAAMVGRQIWKKYDSRGNGGGRATITGFTNSTTVTATVTVNFDSTAAIAGGSWFLTATKVFGLLHMVGQSLRLQLDGAPSTLVTVASDGSLTLPAASSKAHAGYDYLGLAMSMNLDVGGDRGSAQAKVRKIFKILPHFLNTAGAKIGSTLWDTLTLVLRSAEDMTDRPLPLYRGIEEVIPEDSWTRQTRQVVLIKDTPSPQTLLSLDVEVECSDP